MIGCDLASLTVPILLSKIPVAATIGLGSTLQAAVGSVVIKRYIPWPTCLENLNDIYRLMIIGGLIPCAISSTIGVTALFIFNILPHFLLIHLVTWWIGDALGIIIITPWLILLAQKEKNVAFRRKKTVTISLTTVIAIVLSLFYFSKTWEKVSLHQKFEEAVLSSSHDLKRELNYYIQGLKNSERFIKTHTSFNQNDFTVFFKNIKDDYPDAQAI
jgi:integral membrane sensor domain MASE1